MARKRPSRGLIAQIDTEIEELDRERGRLIAARAALARDRAPRISQEEVADYLAEHPASTYIEIADGLSSLPRNIAAHLNRGRVAGRFQSEGGRWSLKG
ncbi:MAG: hypothetical protein WB507_04455 [Solirubrobacterales bacterium]